MTVKCFHGRQPVMVAAVFFFSAVVSLAHLSSDWEVPEEARHRENPQQATEESLAAGRVLFEKQCQACHGPQGAGDGPIAGMLDKKPPAINDAQDMGQMTDGELYWKISKGNPPMPGIEKKTSEEERWHVVNYVRSLSGKK